MPAPTVRNASAVEVAETQPPGTASLGPVEGATLEQM